MVGFFFCSEFRAILQIRMPATTSPTTTLQDIADEYGITRERIRQLEEKVVKKLQTFFQSKGFDVGRNKP